MLCRLLVVLCCDMQICIDLNCVACYVVLCRLLSSKDIQAVVEGGCPNLLRKAVNSAKRLRAHLRLEEGDVRVLLLLLSSSF
jgi:hypothetical protein